ncbi:protein translocase subunit SecF [Caproiciproducens sp. NJN-50]|uniref:protein translocase subunit SecF n=1 Tax=Acutalibacteraceae TaxID=3082771 RepID=UPI000FFE2963|nr:MULTISPECIES: protein translocase subunit SecF [Acutalibacteraceae]QAT49283.1 protein translocase subunit SecF [Caproiciproducens sp. NJN-50]
MRTFQIKFYENRKIFFAISLGIMAIGLLFNIIFGVKLDINFKGGAMIKYSYSGSIDASTVTGVVEKTVNRSVSTGISQDIKSASGDQTLNNVTLTFAGTDSLTVDNQKAIQTALNKEYPNANFQIVESNSVNPTMGRSFFLKCLVAVLLAFLLLDFYIAVRFRKIGGTAAAVFAIVALLHDVAMVYFTFVIFRIALDANFIAVVLTILGYSLNDTIVVYDRIRENRRLLGLKAGYGTLVDTSINQTFTRSVYTAATTFMSVAVVFVVASFYHLTSVTTFALPMMIGVVSGAYSSICIAGPLYVMWEQRKVRSKAARLAAGPAGPKASEPVPAAQVPNENPEGKSGASAQPGKPKQSPKTKQNPKPRGKKRKR